MERILLGQLGANGDCLYATTLANQIRTDYPSAHITWAVSSQCIETVRKNPHINEVWHIATEDWAQHEPMWSVFEREAFRRYKANEFDQVILSQIWPHNFQNYDGTVRPGILRSYGKPITVPIRTVMHVSETEIEKVDDFVCKNNITSYDYRILFECSSKSGQSFMTPDLAEEIARRVSEELPTAMFLYNATDRTRQEGVASVCVGGMTLHEIAYLTHSCTLFVGCGSGGTVAATSAAAKALPTIQVLEASKGMLGSFSHDFHYFGINDRVFVDLCSADPQLIADCIICACIDGAVIARDRFDSSIPVTFDDYRKVIRGTLIRPCRYLDAAKSLMLTAKRYGWTRDLVKFGQECILRNIEADPSLIFSTARREADTFRAVLSDAAADPKETPTQIFGSFAMDQGTSVDIDSASVDGGLR